MKYSHILFTGLLSGGLLLSGCDEELELQPQQTLSADAAFADELTAQGSLIGVYSLAQDLEVYGSMPQVIADYQSDNVDFIGSFPTLQDINDYATLSDNGSLSTLWRDNYETILAANAVIASVPDVDDPGFTAEEKAQFVAEAKFLRALIYFQMVNLFANPINVEGAGALGIPIVNDPFTGEVELPARATVGEVHTQIQQDLQEGVTALPESNLGRATSGAAQALLSRLHLYRGEYQQAADLARAVIDGGVYELASNYAFFSQNTSEEVFSLQNSATDNGRTGSGGWASYYSPAESGGRGDAPFAQGLIDAYAEEPGDLRFSTLIEYSPDSSLIFTDKFSDAVTNSDNVPVIRVTEMYLSLAEALAELNGINQESVDLVNVLRTRAGLTEWTVGQFGNQEEFIDAILVERRKELAFEGHRRMDLLRKGKALRSSGPTADISNPGDPKTIMPIPQREIDLNSNLVQNDGY
ncbi:MAG: RagB/SusD family nutrient uptake outer membrane protein [Cyclobacteriaceae bacterium]